MRKISIVFTKPTAKFVPFADIIRLIWDTEYSHTALVYHSERYNKSLIYHASGSSINFMAADLFYAQNEVVYSKEIEVSDEVFHSIISSSIDLAGRKYGILQSVGVAVAYWLERLGLDRYNPFADGRSKWICSEWVALVLSKIYSDYNPDLETVSPKDVYDFVRSLP